MSKETKMLFPSVQNWMKMSEGHTSMEQNQMDRHPQESGIFVKRNPNEPKIKFCSNRAGRIKIKEVDIVGHQY